MHSNRTTESLLARRKLAEKATPGPWGQVIAGLERVVILRLRAQVERLEKEEDWLISTKIVEEWNGRFVGAQNKDNSGYAVYPTKAEAVASWREAARKAVEKVK